ncbi:MAG: glycosyl hydrolase [Pseudomonadota bacterium]
MSDRDMKTALAGTLLVLGLIAGNTVLAEEKKASTTIQVGAGYFQKTTLDIPASALPDSDIEKSALAVSSTIMGSGVALPTSAWFSSFLRWQSGGALAQDSLFTNPLMFGYRNGGFGRVTPTGNKQFTATGLTLGIPAISVATSANGVLPVVEATLEDDLQLLYGGSYTAQSQKTPPAKIDLQEFDDLLTKWTATSGDGGTFTFHALQGSPFAYFEISDYPVYFNVGGSLTKTATFDAGVTGIDTLLLGGGSTSYALFYQSANATFVTADFTTNNKVLSYSSGNTGQFVVAALPFGLPNVMPDTNQKTFIKAIAALAFNFPTSSAVQYSYDTTTGSISTTFSIATKNSLGATPTTGGDALIALLPHHYTDVATADGNNPSGGALLQNGSTLAVTGDSSWTTHPSGWNVTLFDASTQTPYAPMHANPYQLYGQSAVYYYSVLGPQLLVQGTSFEIEQDVIGLLPWLVLPNSDTDPNTSMTFEDMQKALLFRFMQGDGIALEQYLTNMNYDGNTYSDGKQFKTWAAGSIVANQLGVEGTANYQIDDGGTMLTLADATDRALKKYFAKDPDTAWTGQTSMKRFFTYDAMLNALLGFPAGFGSTVFLNDHNLTFGYFARSASALSAYSAFGLTDWLLATKYADVIDQVVYDVANPFTEDAMTQQASSRYSCSDTTCGGLFSGTFTKNNRKLNGADNPSFPFQRNYDAFGGIGWASGLVTDGRTAGPNTESVSEALNAMAAFVLRAGQTNNKDLFVASLAQWVTQIAASNAYWMDMDGYYSSFSSFATMAQMGDFGTVVAPGSVSQSDFFDGTRSIRDNVPIEAPETTPTLQDPEALRGITVFPVGPHSFYLSKNQAYTKHAYKAARDYAVATSFNSLWNVILTEWEASFDPANAAIDLNNAFQNQITFSGGTKTQTVSNNQSPMNLQDCLNGKVTTTTGTGMHKVTTQVCSNLTGIKKIGGNSFLEIYRWVHFLGTYGTADFDYTANTPFAVVLDKSGTKSFVAYNPTGSSQSISFYRKGAAVTNLTGLSLAANTLQIYDSSGNPQLGETQMLSAAADSFVESGAGWGNEGANPRLSVGSGQDGTKRSLLAFDGDAIGDYLASHDLTSATLILTIENNDSQWGADGQAIEARPLTDDFVEGNGSVKTLPADQQNPGDGQGVTWRCAIDGDIGNNLSSDCAGSWRIPRSGGSLSLGMAEPVQVTDGASTVIRFDITDDVLSGYQAWAIKKVEEIGFGELLFHSREGAALAGERRLAPTLVLSGTPLD